MNSNYLIYHKYLNSNQPKFLPGSLLRLMGTLSGKITLLFSFLPPFLVGSTLIRKEFAPQEQILSFKRIPHFERAQ